MRAEVLSGATLTKEHQDQIGKDIGQFGERDIGYTVAFPGDWTATRLSPAVVLLSGREGTDAYYATVGIQNVHDPPGLVSCITVQFAADRL